MNENQIAENDQNNNENQYDCSFDSPALRKNYFLVKKLIKPLFFELFARP